MSKIPRGKLLQKTYNLSQNRYREMYYFALQYNEWKDELKYKYDTSKAVQITDMPTAHNGDSNPTMDAAIRCAELSRKIEMVETAAKLADQSLYKYIIKGVTNDGINFNYLQTVMNIPCSANTYYDRRRKFYWILSQNLEKFGNQGALIHDTLIES